MDIIIAIDDTEAKTILDQLQSAYGWTGMEPQAVAQKLAGEIKNDLVRRALQGKDTLDRIAAQAAAKTLLEEKMTVAMKV